jgi:flavin-dependent dehydrogenase
VTDVAIIGAGPAGSAAAIELARAGARVLLLEKAEFPRPKVCGEFLSPEGAVAIRELGAGDLLNGAARMDTGVVITPSGKRLEFSFPTPAYGLSRARMDHGLAEHAVSLGASLVTRAEVASLDPLRCRDGRQFEARAVLLACGRHSLLNPAPTGRRSWYGFKVHLRGDWPPRLDLHFFPGGYLGVAPIEDGLINACALVEKRLLKEAQALVERTVHAERVGDYLFTGPLHPGRQQFCILNSAFCIPAGDAAAFTDPFTGDGISLALRSGRLAAEHLLRLLDGAPAKKVAASYTRDLRRICGRQMAASRLLRAGLARPWIEAPASRLLASTPSLRRLVFRMTRG